MSRSVLPTMIGNDFVLPHVQLQAATPIPAPQPMVSFTSVPVQSITQSEFIPVSVATHEIVESPLSQLIDALHHYSLGTFALLFLLVGVAGIKVGSAYWSAHILNEVAPARIVKIAPSAIAGLNISVPSDQLETRLQSIINQPANIVVGDQTLAITPDTIKSWLQVTTSADKSQSYVRVKAATMTKSLTDLANTVVKAPINQVSVTEDGVTRVVVGGQDGTKLTNPDSLKQQAEATAKSVMNGSGLNFSTPTETAAYASVGAEAFDKLIDANVTTKQTYFFENGKLVQQYASSDGKASTPTILGEFHIYQKLASQDMKGSNGDGTTYFQPHVHWINYFAPGGYAVHGVYWHPLSWFGVNNSSHGCVGLPDNEAEWVYNWAPIGTTVITHA